jgi:hypothetical protein
MKRMQLTAGDWEDLRHAKVVSATKDEVANLDIDDDTLATAIDEAQSAGTRSFVILMIGGGAEAEDKDEDEGKDDEDEDEEKTGAQSGHPKRGERRED